MSNNFFNVSGVPGTSASLSSPTIRAEFAAIAAGFDKLPTLSGNGSKLVAVNSGGTALEAVSTISTALTFSASMTFSGTLSVLDSNLQIKDNGDPTKIAQFQTSGITASTTRTYTLPDVSDTLVTLAAVQTLTNKTMSAPVITNGAIITGLTALGTGRTDAQVELQNFVVGKHALLSFYQDDIAGEAAITYGSKLSNGNVSQLVGNFVRFVGGANTWNGTWNSVWGIHNVGGYGSDNTTILSYANNSVWLSTGPTSDLPWDVLPQDNSVSTGNGTTTNAGIKIVNGLVSGWGGIGAENLTLTSDNYSLLIKNDGSCAQLNAVTGGTVTSCINNTVVTSVSGDGLNVSGKLTVSTAGGNVSWSGSGTLSALKVTNLDSNPTVYANYLRVGSIVHVTGYAICDPTAAGAIEFRITPPISTTFTTANDAYGTIVGGNDMTANSIISNSVNNRVIVNASSASTTTTIYYFTFSYEVK